MTPTPISAQDARDILGYYHLPGGIPPGGFKHSLIFTIIKADPGNRAKLRLGFPGLVGAFESQDASLDSIEFLQGIAKGEQP